MPHFLCILWLLDVGVAVANPHFEFSSDRGGKEDGIVEVEHTGKPAGVGVLDVCDFLGGDVEEGHVL